MRFSEIYNLINRHTAIELRNIADGSVLGISDIRTNTDIDTQYDMCEVTSLATDARPKTIIVYIDL